MIFWLVVALMTVAALALVLVPLLRSHRRAPKRMEFDLAIYRDQLHELENDHARGLIGKNQSEAARLEIQRRMLAAGKKQVDGDQPPEATADGARPWPLITTIAVAVPAVAVVLYLMWGTPGMPGQPFSGEAVSGATAGENMAGQSVEAAIANLENRLKQNPGDQQGWLLLGRSLIALERYSDAAKALRTAAALSNNDLDILVSMGEALVFAADGIVTPEARDVFQSALAQNPNDAAAQYYMGMALAQSGRPDEALQLWQKLAAETPIDAPWRGNLTTLMRRAADESGIELGDIPAAPAMNIAPPEESAPGPSQEDMAAAADMTPEDRQQMIRAMVNRLAARLAEEPGDLEGWQRLANAYRVLGEDAKAKDAERHISELQNTDGSAAKSKAPTPSSEDMAAAQGMSAEERNQMIATMVDRLAERLKQNPDDLEGWQRLGQSYAVLGRHDEARDAYGEAAKLAPDDTAVLGDYARAIMSAAGDPTEFPPDAIALYQKIIGLNPEQPDALWFLGFADAAAGRNDGAQDYWTRLLNLLPEGGADHDAVQQALDALAK
jgi:cytochrome c-type biogenesis protein CcmH